MSPHGTFMSWVAENTTLSTRNAQRYMKAFTNYSESEELLTEEVTVERLTAEPRSKPKSAAAAHIAPALPDSAIQQAKDEAATARTAASVATSQAEIGERYGMSQSSIKEVLAVGRNEKISGTTTKCLPKSTYSLYLLTTLDDEDFEYVVEELGPRD